MPSLQHVLFVFALVVVHYVDVVEWVAAVSGFISK
jgi:hypothetical protein